MLGGSVCLPPPSRARASGDGRAGEQPSIDHLDGDGAFHEEVLGLEDRPMLPLPGARSAGSVGVRRARPVCPCEVPRWQGFGPHATAGRWWLTISVGGRRPGPSPQMSRLEGVNGTATARTGGQVRFHFDCHTFLQLAQGKRDHSGALGDRA